MYPSSLKWPYFDLNSARSRKIHLSSGRSVLLI
jgi:hypothetical protein